MAKPFRSAKSATPIMSRHRCADGVPGGTKSLLLATDDPDAKKGTFGHWLFFDMRPETSRLEEAEISNPGTDPLLGKSDFGNAYHDGPEPPVGHGLYRYHFRMAALDVPGQSLVADIEIHGI